MKTGLLEKETEKDMQNANLHFFVFFIIRFN